MESRKKYYQDLKNEIINDPTNQRYNDIFRKNYENPRDKYTKIAEKINTNRKDLKFPIVRANIVEFVMRDD